MRPANRRPKSTKSFAIAAACGAIVLAVTSGTPAVDQKLCEIFDDFARKPDVRREIEAGLEAAAQCAVETHARGALFRNEADALAAELAASIGDASALAAYGAGIADGLRLEGFGAGACRRLDADRLRADRQVRRRTMISNATRADWSRQFGRADKSARLSVSALGGPRSPELREEL